MLKKFEADESGAATIAAVQVSTQIAALHTAEAVPDPDYCPRQISFLLPGNPAVRVTATEGEGANAGKILFTVDVEDTTTSTGDLRALFFDINEAKLGGMTVTSESPLLTETRVLQNGVLDLGDGANLSGKTKAMFDVGLEWGTPGGKKDDINFAVSFTLSNATNDLTLDDIAHQRFGAKLDSIGGPGGVRNQTTKLLGEAPAAPDATDDSFSIFEDGAANLNSPSKAPAPVVFNVLANDTDGDGDQLTIMSVHGGEHGTVEISADGLSILYTPALDYSGADSFEYCVSDGNGGQDSAVVNVAIEAVADDPLISFSIEQGSNINEMVLTVVATQNDADGSEYVDQINVSNIAGLPAGATITPGGVNPGTTPGSITQAFVVTTAAATDYNFNIDVNAVAIETSNGDAEDATGSQNIEIDYTHNLSNLVYEVRDQSIWSTGDAFVYDLDEFYGIDYFNADHVDVEPLGIDLGGYEYELRLQAGLDVAVHFEAGSIDADIPVDVTVNTTYNKTTDTIYIDSFTMLGSGGGFQTSGPEGSAKLDFLFNGGAAVRAWITNPIPFTDDIELFNFSKSFDYNYNILDFDSGDPPFVWNIDSFGAVGLEFEWPHLSVANAPGTLAGSGTSNNFLELVWDIDATANALLDGALSWIDSDPSTEDNFEVVDVDLVGGLNFIQDFAISLGGSTVSLVLEDGATVDMTFGTGLTIENASSHDANNDGIIEFSFDFTPQAQLSNTTTLGVELNAEFALIRNLDIAGTSVTLVDETVNLASAPIVDVYNQTFALNGIGAQSVEFFG